MTVAGWCVLAAVVLPYVWYAAANAAAKGLRSNRYPRDFAARLEGLPKRAMGAHLNSFEALPGFAAGVILAQLAHAPQARVDALALAFVVLRVVYGVLYLADMHVQRSVAWALAFACTVGLFVLAA